jgi:diguanylate cyclase (GGDEF)-like protein/PAS domain S-box-containing protein
MYVIAAHVTHQQDWRLSLPAAVLCLLAVFSAFSLLSCSGGAQRLGRNGWTAAAALALGIGVWSAHVIAQLAFMAEWDLRQDFSQTGIAIILATVIAAIGLGFIQMGFRAVAAGLVRQRMNAILGGAILGGSLAALHYAGLAALQVPGRLVFDRSGVALSVVLVILCGIGASLLLRRSDDLRRRFFAAITLTLGLAGLQAVTLVTTGLHLDHLMQVELPVTTPAVMMLTPQGIAVGLALAVALMLAIGLAAALVEQHLVATHKREAARLRLSENRLRQLADATFEGIALHRDGWIIDANAAICSMLGLDPRQVIGHHVLEVVADSSQTQVKVALGAARRASSVMAELGMARPGGDEAACAEAGHDGELAPIEINLRHGAGHLIPVEFLGRRLSGEEGDLRVVAVRDISERKAAEERIRHMANHDALTGLPNRTLFQDRLTQAVARSKRGTSTAAVLCLDLDRFKNINDIRGNAVGDEMLRQVALRLANSVRGDDTVARLSGDEFAIIQVGVAHPDGPAILADRLVKVLAEPFEVAGHLITVSISIGISLFPGDGEDDEELLRAADTALYRAKAAGRGTFRFFEAEMDVRLQERRRLERDLRQALANNQLDLHYQPLVDCDGVKVLGFEALARWTHPERGIISPADFIPLAEESGLIMPLGNWVLRRACRDAMTWPDNTIVAVNLSPVQFRQSNVVSEILGVLAETGLPPHRLELEITEGVLIDDPERVLAILSDLKAAGVRLSLDDFGTGYSSLSYLQRFPFDKMKIDRSFIWEMEKNPDSMAIVRAVIALGRSLRITVTAEGVETAQQLMMLRAEQCDQAQGFLIGKPQPYADATALLANPQLVIEKVRAAE